MKDESKNYNLKLSKENFMYLNLVKMKTGESIVKQINNLIDKERKEYEKTNGNGYKSLLGE